MLKKASIILIQRQAEDLPKLMRQLGLGDYEPFETTNLGDCLYPETGVLCAGTSGGITVFTHQQMPDLFYSDDRSVFEEKMVKLISGDDILVASLNRSIKLFGFAVIQNGIKTRAKMGFDTNPEYFTYGEVQPFESGDDYLEITENAILSALGEYREISSFPIQKFKRVKKSFWKKILG
jgi:hypothetical protein